MEFGWIDLRIICAECFFLLHTHKQDGNHARSGWQDWVGGMVEVGLGVHDINPVGVLVV